MTAQKAGQRRTASSLIPSDTEVALWNAFKRDGSSIAREQLFRHYLPLARQLAGRHFRNARPGAIEFAELVQMASTGLLEAIDRYKPDLGVPFRYFGNRRITGSILNGIAAHSEVNRQVSVRNRMVRERMESLRRETTTDGTLIETLDLLGEIAAGLAIGFMLEESGSYVAVDCDLASNGYETLAWKQITGLLAKEVDRLPVREQDIVRLHYRDGMSFEQLGALFGLTKGRISQLHKSAIALMRKRLLQMGPFIFRG
jgi:RNA polymerase sigma factor FliA